ncbi:MAG: TolC family protein [Ewingella sp.]|uniref:TolC family protein n=1 Tax=Ewingella allii TaxID=3092550 RepID=UPI00264DEAB2|nr:TolC family protein [Ewingella sp.]
MRLIFKRFIPSILLLIFMSGSASAAALEDEQDIRQRLRQSLSIAMARDSGVRQKQAEWDAAAEDVATREGERWPQVSVSSSWLPLMDRGNGEGNRQTTNLNASLSLPLFDWGRLTHAIENRRYRAVVAGENYRAALDELALKVSENHLNLARKQAVLELAQAYTARMSELVAMLERITQADAGRRSELTQASARLLQAEQARDDTQYEINTLTVELEKWLGTPSLSVINTASRWKLRVPNLKSALASSDNNPLIRELEAEHQAQLASVEEEKAKSLPNLSLVASKTLANPGYDDNQIGVRVSWNAFTGFSDTSRIKAAGMRASALKDQLAQRKKETHYTLKSQHETILRLAHREQAWRQLAVESEQIRMMFYKQWYHLGKRTLLDVLIAETEHYNNQVNAVTSHFDRYVQIITLRRNAGQLLGWLENGQPDHPALP